MEFVKFFVAMLLGTAAVAMACDEKASVWAIPAEYLGFVMLMWLTIQLFKIATEPIEMPVRRH